MTESDPTMSFIDFDGLFAVDTYPDGVRAADLQAAIQAAWRAGDRALAKELADRYGLYDRLCLRCAERHISGAANPPMLQSDPFLYQLCNECLWAETWVDRQRRLRRRT
jgi:hypothetical protein